MKQIALSIVALLLFCATQAQKNRRIIDSLEKLVLVQKDSALANTYNELTWQYRTVNRDKAMEYGNKAIELATKIKYPKSIAQAYNDMGIIYMDKQDYARALASYDKSLEIRQKLKDQNGMAAVYLKKGIIYQKSSKYEKSLENALKALEIYDAINNDYGKAAALNNAGLANQNIGNLDKAMDYFKKSIAIKERIKDRSGLAGTYLGIGNIYFFNNNYTDSKTYFDKSEEIAAKIGDVETLSVVYHNLAAWNEKAGTTKEGIEYIEAALDLRKKAGDIKGQVSSLNVWGGLLTKEKKYKEAEDKLQQGLILADTLASCLQEKGRIYRSLQNLYEAMGDFKKAGEASRMVVVFTDSVHTDELTKKFTEIETKYQTLEKEKLIQQQQSQLTKKLYELSQRDLLLSQNQLVLASNELEIKKQNEKILEQRLDSTQKEENIQSLYKQGRIKELELNNQKLLVNKKNITITVISIVTLMLLLLGISVYRRYKLKKEKQLQETIFKQQELATKAILEAEENERKRIAGDLHDGIGQLMSAAKMNLSAIENEIPFANTDQRKVYEKAQNLVDESCKEVRAVSHNMMPNALLKSGLASAVREFLNQIDSKVIKIDLYTEGLNERIDANVETVLYRVIQESVNNVIKHAGANHLDISLIKDADGIAATIEDNGKGFDTLDKNKFEGIGLKNIQTRVEYLKGSVEWNSSLGKGTLVAIHVPLM